MRTHQPLSDPTCVSFLASYTGSANVRMSPALSPLSPRSMTLSLVARSTRASSSSASADTAPVCSPSPTRATASTAGAVLRIGLRNVPSPVDGRNGPECPVTLSSARETVSRAPASRDRKHSLDLDRHAIRQRAHADCRTGMASGLAEYLHEKIRGSVDDLRL